MASEGLLVTHVTYNDYNWQHNKVNNALPQGMTIIAADGLPNDSTEVGDLYPWNGNNQLSDTSMPPAAVNTGGYMGKPVTNITMHNAVVTFDFMLAPVTGDLNGDGKVDITDVNLVINILLGIEDTPADVDAADLDGNGAVDIADVNLLINIILEA